MTRPIRVVLADDHELVLEGLRSLLDSEEDIAVLAAARSGEELLAAVAEHEPDVVVLDLEMGETGGLACLKAIRGSGRSIRVLVLTAYSDGETMRTALEGGADGYALKTDPPQHTVQAIRHVHAGQLVFPLAAKRWLLGRTAPPGSSQLTDREREVLALVAEGLTNSLIARRLRVSENTVKFHLQNLFLKLGVSNRTEAAARYLKDGPPA